MTAVAPEAELSQEQSAALTALQVSLKKGYRQAQKAMASIATSIVDLRMTFMKDGKPDYRGDTAEYRAVIGHAYEEMLSDEEERSHFQQNIRYWISKEFMARVQSGKLDASDLADSGVKKPAKAKAAAARKRTTKQEVAPTHAQADGNSKEVNIDDGVVKRDGKVLSPKEVRKLAEGITVEYLAEIGPVTLLRSVTSELKRLLEALDDPNASINAEASVFRGAVKNLLVTVQSLAEKSGVEIPGAVAPVTPAEEDKGDRLTRRDGDTSTKGRGRGRPKKEETAASVADPQDLAAINWPS